MPVLVNDPYQAALVSQSQSSEKIGWDGKLQGTQEGRNVHSVGWRQSAWAFAARSRPILAAIMRQQKCRCLTVMHGFSTRSYGDPRCRTLDAGGMVTSSDTRARLIHRKHLRFNLHPHARDSFPTLHFLHEFRAFDPRSYRHDAKPGSQILSPKCQQC